MLFPFINYSHLLDELHPIYCAIMASSIDLTNFTEPQFRESQYVLTSPRSLKACANLKIEVTNVL